MLLKLSSLNEKSILVKFISIIISSVLLFSCSNQDRFREHGSHNSKFDSRDIARDVDTFTFYGEHISPEKEQELLAENLIYFGYDKDDITYRYELVLLAHAKKMLENPRLKLRIDGHTDERGSAEYNIGLGERRAKAVARFMEFKGVNHERFVILSYGKEKPAVTGHSEEAWRLNRRAELVYE